MGTRGKNYVRQFTLTREPDSIALSSVMPFIHLAAESHVDRSISEPAAFITTNVVGTDLRSEHKQFGEAFLGTLHDNSTLLHIAGF